MPPGQGTSSNVQMVGSEARVPIADNNESHKSVVFQGIYQVHLDLLNEMEWWDFNEGGGSDLQTRSTLNELLLCMDFARHRTVGADGNRELAAFCVCSVLN